eukprot:scaffold1880_cov166-Amphora_coffeaeformis.AAC.5
MANYIQKDTLTIHKNVDEAGSCIESSRNCPSRQQKSFAHLMSVPRSSFLGSGGSPKEPRPDTNELVADLARIRA